MNRLELCYLALNPQRISEKFSATPIPRLFTANSILEESWPTIDAFIHSGLSATVSVYSVLLYKNTGSLTNNVVKAWSNLDMSIKQRHDVGPLGRVETRLRNGLTDRRRRGTFVILVYGPAGRFSVSMR